MRTSATNRSESRRGIVIVVVTVVLVLVSLSLYGFVAVTQTEHKATRLRGDQIKAEQVAESGRQLLIELVRAPRAQRASLGQLQDNPTLFQNIAVDVEPNSTRQGRFFVVAPGVSANSPPYRFGVVNESAKLDLSGLLEWDKQHPGSGRDALMQLPGMTESIADAILDWIDADSLPRQFGAEADYYLGLPSPIQPANKPPAVLEELLLVRDVTRELLFGLDRNENYRIDPREREHAPRSARDGGSAGRQVATLDAPNTPPWSRYLALHGAERNEDYWGRPRVFLNDPVLSRLHQQLTVVLDRSWANFIVAYRQFGPDDRSANTPLDDALAPEIVLDLTRPPRIAIKSHLDLVDARVAVTDSGSKQVLASPLRSDELANSQELLQFCDRTSVRPEAILTGRVNINEAPAEVLRAIPGMRPEVVERILVTRTAVEQVTGDRTLDASWILTKGLVELAEAKSLLPYLTVGGDVIRAQVIGCYDDKSPWFRGEVVLDGTTIGAPTRCWKDLNRVGRGFALSQLLAVRGGQRTGPLAKETARENVW